MAPVPGDARTVSGHRGRVDTPKMGMADYSITAANVLASSRALKKTGVAGAAITAGQPLYEDAADGKKLKLADANDTELKAEVVGIALHAAAAGQPVSYVYQDDDFTPGTTLAVGAILVLSGTAGGIAPSSDLATGMRTTLLGVAKSTTKARINIGSLARSGAAAA